MILRKGMALLVAAEDLAMVEEMTEPAAHGGDPLCFKKGAQVFSPSVSLSV